MSTSRRQPATAIALDASDSAISEPSDVPPGNEVGSYELGSMPLDVKSPFVGRLKLCPRSQPILQMTRPRAPSQKTSHRCVMSRIILAAWHTGPASASTRQNLCPY